MMNILTFDYETTYGEMYGRKANPFCTEHNLCSSHFKLNNGRTKHKYFVGESDEDGHSSIDSNRVGGKFNGDNPLPDLSNVSLFIGANIKFDAIWTLASPGGDKFQAALAKGARIYDILYAEYLLSGQIINLHQIPQYRTSLNNCARMNGLEHQKLDEVAELWNVGVRTEDINPDILLPYGDRDVDLTYEIYKRQMDKVSKQSPAFIQMFWSRMEGLLATTFMEYNGLMIDMEAGLRIAAELKAEVQELQSKFEQYVPPLPEVITDKFNTGSSSQLQAFLWGGEHSFNGRVQRTNKDTGELIYKKIEVPEVDLLGKPKFYIRGKNAGKQKYIKVDSEEVDYKNGKIRLRFKGIIPVLPDHKKGAEDADGNRKYSTDAETMEKYADAYPDFEPIQVLSRLRKISKDLSTYYISESKDGKQKGMLTNVHPDGRIHHTLNHYVTATARMSSSNPNMQNIPNVEKSIVKQLFCSRFDHGYMCEIDYSQLEVICKAVLSGDPQLIQDVLDGIDKHCLNLAFAENRDYTEVVELCKTDKEWKLKRKDIKPYTFQSQYGGGKKIMAKATGRSIEDIEQIIERNKVRYPTEVLFDEFVLESVKTSSSASPFRTVAGMPANIGYYKCITGTMYGFTEMDAPQWLRDRDGVNTSFKPTQTKNFPSQGLGGYIMQDALGILIRWWLAHPQYWDKIILCNTVHDCVWIDFDCLETIQEVLPKIVGIMEDVPARMKRLANVDWIVPFRAETEIGKDMFSLTHITPESTILEKELALAKA